MRYPSLAPVALFAFPATRLMAWRYDRMPTAPFVVENPIPPKCRTMSEEPCLVRIFRRRNESDESVVGRASC